MVRSILLFAEHEHEEQRKKEKGERDTGESELARGMELLEVRDEHDVIELCGGGWIECFGDEMERRPIVRKYILK